MKLHHIALAALVLCSGCSGCSRSGRLRAMSGKLPFDTSTASGAPAPAPAASASGAPAAGASGSGSGSAEAKPASGKTVVRMRKDEGVYKIPVKVNGTDMEFIFDTGAGMISISNVEASFMYKQGKLKDEDVVGQANFIDANGNISPGTIVTLREVSIGDRTIHDVQASVVNNSKAPLLFGQTAMERFGKISIDYNNETITLE
jgi:aspartyl protease family protein